MSAVLIELPINQCPLFLFWSTADTTQTTKQNKRTKKTKQNKKQKNYKKKKKQIRKTYDILITIIYYQLKCTQYWPEKMMSRLHGEIVIQNVEEKEYAFYVIRKLTVSLRQVHVYVF